MKAWMKGVALGALTATLAGAAYAEDRGAAAAPRDDVALATPAPVPGTLDYQFAALQSAAPPARAAQGSDSPSVGMARRAIDAAGAFDGYTRRASAIAGLKDGPGVVAAVETSASYEASQLQEGAVAWGALAALQDPMFVKAVRAAAPDAAARDALADQLASRPASVLRLPGAHAAAGRITRLVGARGAALIEAGAGVNKASYAVQHEAWSKAPIAHADADLQRVKGLSGRRAELTAAQTQALMSGLTGLRSEPVSDADEAGFRPTPATAQALALAALAVLGRAGEDHIADVSHLLSTDQGADCLKLAKLNLYQCLAVAGPHYEDMFCLGRHALSDTGQCVMSTAGWSGPAKSPAAPVTLAAVPASRAVAPTPVAVAIDVPVAVAALDGPERARAYADPAPAPAEPAAEPSRFDVARADLPSFRTTARPERLDEAEDDGVAYARPSPYRAAPQLSPRDAADDEDDLPPPPRRPYGYGMARADYRWVTAYDRPRRRYADPAPPYGYADPPEANDPGGWGRGLEDDGDR